MTQTWFRVQSGDEQISRIWAGGERFDDDAHTSRDRHGISVCASREDLAAYLAGPGAGIPYGSAGWVIVELTGYHSDDAPLDREDGEQLIHPTEIISVTEIDDNFFDMIGAAYDALEGN